MKPLTPHTSTWQPFLNVKKKLFSFKSAGGSGVPTELTVATVEKELDKQTWRRKGSDEFLKIQVK